MLVGYSAVCGIATFIVKICYCHNCNGCIDSTGLDNNYEDPIPIVQYSPSKYPCLIDKLMSFSLNIKNLGLQCCIHSSG